MIADLFSRMHFMERRGSGFKKIKADYRNAANFTEEKMPVFTSTATSFFVTLYNLNYSATENATDNATENATENIEKRYPEIQLIRDNPEITTTQIAFILHKDRTTIARRIKKLKELGILERVGSDRKGYWTIK